MVIPKWQAVKKPSDASSSQYWDKLIAIIAIANFIWIVFDISYIPYRSFWVNRKINLTELSSISLTWIPDLTKFYDKIKGINTSFDKQDLKTKLNLLDNYISGRGVINMDTKNLLDRYHISIKEILEEKVITSKSNRVERERAQALIIKRAGKSNLNDSIKEILSPSYINVAKWDEEKYFWEKRIMPILANTYTREIDKKGNPIDNSWRIDLPFQLIFLIDILVKIIQTKIKFPKIRLTEAIARRWIDLVILIPGIRLMRIVPFTGRVLNAKLISIEPIRTVVSKWIVAFLAIEIIEVLTIRTVDYLQKAIKTPLLANKVRGLCSYQSVNDNEASKISELIRIWLPILLNNIGPNMRSQLINLFDYAIKKSIKAQYKPTKNNEVLFKAESAISLQLATSIIDTILGISKSAGSELAKKDLVLQTLTIKTIDRFWEEVALALEKESTLEESRLILVSLLESLKISSLNEMRSQSDLNEIINELDSLNFN